MPVVFLAVGIRSAGTAVYSLLEKKRNPRHASSVLVEELRCPDGISAECRPDRARSASGRLARADHPVDGSFHLDGSHVPTREVGPRRAPNR
jgi:hypothetical protein